MRRRVDINVLYLSVRVLILLDLSYFSRFWVRALLQATHPLWRRALGSAVMILLALSRCRLESRSTDAIRESFSNQAVALLCEPSGVSTP